jgi:DNA-dependent RNA polymerase auxiliary subunit epsilon
MEQLNIVELIENNPVTTLSKEYNVKFLTKIKGQFTDFEQKIFLSSFYCYINYDSKNDFVIDLDNVWKWLDFSSKFNAKRLLENNFIIDKDYKKSLLLKEKQTVHTKGGQNREIFMLNINTFKKFCLKAGTKKADEIHEYFIKLEEILQETIKEESNELKLLLEKEKNDSIQNYIHTIKEKEDLKEKTLLEQFPNNTQCIYIGLIDNKTLGKPNSKMYHETLIKFGQSNNLNERVKTHKKTYENFRLYNAFKVKNKIEIENCIKKHCTLKNRLRIVTIDDIAHRELIALDDNEFTLDKVEQLIKDVIKENEYNIENYNLLLKRNDELQEEIYKLKDQLNEQNKLLENNNKKIQKLEYDVTDEIKNKICSNYAICKYGYFLYAYQYDDMRFVCSITRQKDFETIVKNLKELYPSGEMICQVKCSYPLTEKNMMFILKQNCVSLGQNKFESSSENIKKILDVSVKLEELLIKQSNDIDSLTDFLSNNFEAKKVDIDPEVPLVRKAKRSIDKINRDTGEIIATYESIEAAGRSCGLTTGTAIGIAVRENRQCQGFLWRYSGVSKEEQFAEQPVIKISCKNGEKLYFKNIADAAKDAKISAPALRRRILTDVHVNNYHWVFDKNASHYK